LKFLSHNNIVIAPAKTGKANSNKIAVTKIAHENKLILCKLNPPALILSTVEIKLTAPNNEETPLK
jgi:hypothetical protein